MVKGNADRRRELAQKRKDDKKDENARKTSGALRATPAEVRARLLSDARAAGGAGEAQLTAWVLAAPTADGIQAKELCESFWRTGACPRKRCRGDHTDSIAHLRNVPSAGAAETEADDGDASGTARGMLPALVALPLRAAEPGGALVFDRTMRGPVRQENRLYFVALADTLVFDVAHPEVFAGYADRHAAAAAAAGDGSAGVERAVSPSRAVAAAAEVRAVSRGRAGSKLRSASKPRAAAVPVGSEPAARARSRSRARSRLRSGSPLAGGAAGGASAGAPVLQPVQPTLHCRRCATSFATVEDLRGHFREAHDAGAPPTTRVGGLLPAAARPGAADAGGDKGPAVRTPGSDRPERESSTSTSGSDRDDAASGDKVDAHIRGSADDPGSCGGGTSAPSVRFA